MTHVRLGLGPRLMPSPGCCADEERPPQGELGTRASARGWTPGSRRPVAGPPTGVPHVPQARATLDTHPKPGPLPALWRSPGPPCACVPTDIGGQQLRKQPHHTGERGGNGGLLASPHPWLSLLHSVSPSVSLSPSLSVSPSLSLCLSLYLQLVSPSCLSPSLSVSLSLCLHLSLHPPLSLSLCPSPHIFLCEAYQPPSSSESFLFPGSL